MAESMRFELMRAFTLLTFQISAVVHLANSLGYVRLDHNPVLPKPLALLGCQDSYWSWRTRLSPTLTGCTLLWVVLHVGLLVHGGNCGSRTHGAVTPSNLANCRTRPLCEVSMSTVNGIRTVPSGVNPGVRSIHYQVMAGRTGFGPVITDVTGQCLKPLD
jgi:hypothetical protein